MLLPLPDQIEVRDHSLAYALAYEELGTESALDLLAVLADSGFRSIEIPTRVLHITDRPSELVGQLRHWPRVKFSMLSTGAQIARRALDMGLVDLECIVPVTQDPGFVGVNSAALELLSQVADCAHDGGGICEARLTSVWHWTSDGATDLEAVVQVVGQAISAGADRIRLEDTVGIATPTSVVDVVSRIRDVHPQLPLYLRVQDSRGMGIANVLAAMQANATGVDAAIGGLDASPSTRHRQRNVATEAVVYMAAAMGVETGIDLNGLFAAGFWIDDALGRRMFGESLLIDELRTAIKSDRNAAPVSSALRAGAGLVGSASPNAHRCR
jgi:hydroxymethylglutaryl-CoA lyase